MSRERDGENKQICKKGAQHLSSLIYKMGTMITLRLVVRMESDRAGHPESSAHTLSFLPSSYNYICNVVSKGSWKWKVKVFQPHLTLWNPKACSMPGSSVHGKNTGVGSHSLLQGIFPTQGLNPGLLRCRRTLHHLNHQEAALSDLPNEMYCPSFHYSLLKFYFISDAVLHSHFSQMERQSTFLSWEMYKLPERRKSMFLITC